MRWVVSNGSMLDSHVAYPLARAHGIDTSGTAEEVCERVRTYILEMVKGFDISNGRAVRIDPPCASESDKRSMN